MAVKSGHKDAAKLLRGADMSYVSNNTVGPVLIA